MRKISFTPEAYVEYVNWLVTDRKILLKITDLIRDASRGPARGIGKPELLKHEFKGCWSRRINQEHSWFILFLKVQLKLGLVNTITIKT